VKKKINSLLLSESLKRWEVFEKTLLIVVLLDLALGGNGYLVEIGGLRLRVILYGFCMAWVILRLTRIQPIRLDAPLVYLSIFFAAVTAFDAALGYFAGYRVEAIAAELKPLCYFPMLLFFLVTIRTREDLTLVAAILVACGMLLAFLYLTLLLTAIAGIVERSSIYEFLNMSDEFIFRRDPRIRPFVGFFYKGYFYVCIAALSLLFDSFRITKILAAIALLSIGMTLTRGLCVAIVACIIAGIALGQKWKRALMLVGQGALLLTTLFFAQQAEMLPLVASSQSPGAGGQQLKTNNGPGSERPKEDPCLQDSLCGKFRSSMQTVTRTSDNLRADDIKYIVKELDFSMATVGRGLGAPIRDRERIEMTYLEVFYKQGLPGLSVWLVLFLYTFYLYLKVPRETKEFGLVFFLSSLFVFVVTASNTFLTGSIGMAVVFIALASLLVLTREDPRPMPAEDWYGRWPMRLLRA
jgi:hypothetical protein